MSLLTLAVLASGPAGIVLHELAHAIPAYLSGTLVEVGYIRPSDAQTWLPGFYVRNSEPNRWSLFGPLAYALPGWAIVHARPTASDPLVIFAAFSLGVAVLAWVLSDLPAMLWSEEAVQEELEYVALWQYREVSEA